MLFIGEIHGFRRSVRQAQRLQRILEAHDAEAHGAMLQVGMPRFRIV